MERKDFLGATDVLNPVLDAGHLGVFTWWKFLKPCAYDLCTLMCACVYIYLFIIAK